MVTFVASGFKGMALNLNTFTVGVVIFGNERFIRQGDVVVRTGQLISVSVGENLLGRVIDPLGNLLDQTTTNGSAEHISEVRRIEVKAPGIIARHSVFEPFQTGLKEIDSL